MQSARYSCQILKKLESSRQIFEKYPQASNFMEIRQVGAQLFHSGGQTDVTKLIAAFRNLANAPREAPLFKCKDSVLTSQRTQCSSIRKTNRLMIFFGNNGCLLQNSQDKNKLRGQNRGLGGC